MEMIKYIYIPYYAQSAGTAVALSCKNIHITQTGFITPVDAQIYYEDKYFSAADFLSCKKYKKYLYDNILISYSKKYYDDSVNWIIKIWGNNEKLLKNLASGHNPHYKAFLYKDMQEMGVEVILDEMTEYK